MSDKDERIPSDVNWPYVVAMTLIYRPLWQMRYVILAWIVVFAWIEIRRLLNL
jgi:hypothetical protein